MTALVEELVPDELWAVVEPLPPPPRPWWGGRVRAIPARTCLAAIVDMARTSSSWRLLLPGSWAAARQPRCRACQPHRGLPGRAAEDTWRSRNPRVERSRWSQLGGSCWRWRPDLAAQAAASHRANGQDSRRDGRRSVCGRIGCMARSSARTAGSSASLISPKSAVRPGLARLDASSRVAAVGCSGALTAESGEDLG